MKIINTALVGIAFFSITSCMAQKASNNLLTKDVPEWLSIKIKKIENGGSTTKGLVEQYTYKKRQVYLVDFCQGCADDLVQVYSKEGKVICEFGGFSGSNTCPDFSSKAILNGSVWIRQ